VKSVDWYFESLLRFENLLIFLPAVIAYLLCIFADTNYCDVILFNDHYVISHLQAGIFWVSILFIPYTFHYVLKKSGKDNLLIIFLHVCITLSIVFYLPVIYTQLPPVKFEWELLTAPPPAFEKWKTIVAQANLLWQTFIIVQVVFILYAVFVLFSGKKITGV
jgi:hypothetical protein